MQLLFTGIVTLMLSACGAPQPMDHEHAPGMEGMNHDHHGEGMEVEGVVPTVDLVLHKDPMSGWNAEIMTTHFQFSPRKAGLDHKEGEGHAHIYVNGEKINRLYGNWYHLANVGTGDTVMVNLNTNNHMPLLYEGIEISDEEIAQ